MTRPVPSVSTLARLDLAELAAEWPTPQLVTAAAAMFVRDESQPTKPSHLRDGVLHGFREGPQWRIEVSPGSIAVRSTDLARSERTLNRQAEQIDPHGRDWTEGPHCLVGSCLHDSCRALRFGRAMQGLIDERLDGKKPTGGRVITSWSRKSRSRMVHRLSTLDYGPMIGDGTRSPVMVTLTYPGDWIRVAPSAAACTAHLKALSLRFKRAYKVPLVGVWKREFQSRGAPHFHILMVPPVAYSEFVMWLSSTWADVVAAPDPMERRRHLVAGTGVDVAKGATMKDPRRIGVYFSKHGAFAAKDYQNEAPDLWVGGMQPQCVGSCEHESCQIKGGSTGRFWGRWGLKPAEAAVHLTPREALHAARVLARWHRANRHMKRMPGEKWPRREPTMVPHGHMGTLGPIRIRPLLKQRAGYLVVNDGPALAAQLARQLDQWSGRGTSACGPSGAGPVGFLP